MADAAAAPGGATVQADIAIQPGVIGDTLKRNPLQNIKKSLKKKKKLASFKEWIKFKNEGETNESR